MKRIIALLVISACTISLIYAQPVKLPAYEIKSDTAQPQTIGDSSWEKLEDKIGKWTFEEVSSLPLSAKFHKQGIKPDGIDTTDVHTFWYRYKLINDMQQDARISFSSNADYFDVYILFPDHSVSHYRSGMLMNWNKKNGMKYAWWVGAIPIVLKSGEEITVYDRRNWKNETNYIDSVQIFPTSLFEQWYIAQTDSRKYIFSEQELQEAFMLGMLFLSAMFSLFFFRITREKVFIYFTIYAFFFAINRLVNIAGSYTFWYKPELSIYVGYFRFAWAFIPLFLILFIGSFFKTRLRHPLWNKILIATGAVQFLLGLITAIYYTFTKGYLNLFEIPFALLTFFIIPGLLLIICIMNLKSKIQSDRYLAYGAMPYLLLYILTGFVGIRIEDTPGSGNPFTGWLFENFRILELITIALLISSFTWVLFMRFNQLRKVNIQQALEKERIAKENEVARNELILNQKIALEKEVEARTSDLKKSLAELKEAQSQLILNEKMASLGELTAGIAHEIQNPLNFVNNFSELNLELINEMEDNIDKGDFDTVKDLANTVKDNEEKINQHGKRADGIVKSMLQHSRGTTTQKELTDINALCDEYLRLSYHGMRAKDKSFNCEIKTEFDTSLPHLKIVPQDIGRVILNLINNAFYAAREKSKEFASNVEAFKPLVTVGTKRVNGKIEVFVKDNGRGIPDNIKEKIFQPFFTTKPTGHGTGLGLSLSYDIIKAHGGEIKVDTKDGEGTEFVISLPV